MKKTTKLIISGLGLVLGSLVLSGCTKSFCNVDDQAHILYMFDYGVTQYYDSNAEDRSQLFTENNNIFVKYTDLDKMPEQSGIASANKKAKDAGAPIPSMDFWKALDEVVLDKALEKSNLSKSTVTYSELFQSLNDYGYLKFATTETKGKVFDNFESYVQEAGTKVSVDDCPTQDYIKAYEASLSATIASYRSCFTIEENQYGYYGYDSGIDGFRPNPSSVTMSKKTWGGAWKQGLFQGLLIYPIGWVLESFIGLFSGHDIANLQNGVPQVLGLLLITFLVRGLVLLITFKQTTATSKMQLLQPEMAKIQRKYAGKNDQRSQQMMQQETMALYKKNNINPIGCITTMFLQFPIFMAMYEVVQRVNATKTISTNPAVAVTVAGDFALHNTKVFGIFEMTTSFFSATDVKDKIFGLVVALLFGGVTFLQQKLGQRPLKYQKKYNDVKNQKQSQQQNQMKWMMIIMNVMFVFMSLSSTSLGIYWLIGGVYQIGQTQIGRLINERNYEKQQKKNNIIG